MRCDYVIRKWVRKKLMSLGYGFADVPRLISLCKSAASPVDLTAEFGNLGLSSLFTCYCCCDESTLRLLAEEMFARVRVECRCGCREEALDFERKVAAAKLKERHYDDIKDEEERLQKRLEDFFRDDDTEEVDPNFLKALKVSG